MSIRPSQYPFPRELEQGLRHDPARWAELRRVWDSLEEAEPAAGLPGPEADWAQIAARLDDRKSTPRAADRPARSRLSQRMLLRAGITVLGLLAFVSVVWQFEAAVDVPPGAQRTIALWDGSQVHLNSGSRVHYRRAFMILPFVPDPSRTVRLEGEAYFDVASDPDRPFVVKTTNANIEVIGTRFNVRVRPRSGAMETVVTLAEGRVQVTSRAASAHGEPVGRASVAVLDSAGATSVVYANGVPGALPRQMTLERALAWRERGFAAVDEPVGDILRELEIRFAIRISTQPELDVQTPMTVFYRRGTGPEQIIHDICLERGWQYRPASKGYEVFEAPGPSVPPSDVKV